MLGSGTTNGNQEQNITENGLCPIVLSFLLLVCFQDGPLCMVLTFHTGNSIWISCVPCSTGTIASVLSGRTVSILGTGTGIHTLLPPTSQVIRAVWILQTFVGTASMVRISLMIFSTDADGPMVLGLADGIDSTLFIEARILTLPLNASLVICTLTIAPTASYILGQEDPCQLSFLHRHYNPDSEMNLCERILRSLQILYGSPS